MSHSSAREMWRRMSIGQSPVIGLLAVVSAGLTAVAAYFWSVVAALRTPITPGLPVAATFLPLVNGVAMWYLTKIMPRRQSRVNPAWSLQAGIISILLVIIDTVVVTQSINNMPQSAVSCPIERTWRGWFQAKDARSIRNIQDAFNCCGLNTYKDQAWPFANQKQNITADACSVTFGRGKAACFDPWSQSHRFSASMFMIVGVVTLLSKGVIFLVYRRRANKPIPSTQRLIGDGTTNGTHNSDQNNTSVIAGLRMRPDERIRSAEGGDDDDAESVVDENSRLLKDSDRSPQYETPRQLESGERAILPAIDNGVWGDEPSRTHAPR